MCIIINISSLFDWTNERWAQLTLYLVQRRVVVLSVSNLTNRKCHNTPFKTFQIIFGYMGKTKTLNENTCDKCYTKRPMWSVRNKNAYDIDITETNTTMWPVLKWQTVVSGRNSLWKFRFRADTVPFHKRGPEVKPLISGVVETLPGSW